MQCPAQIGVDTPILSKVSCHPVAIWVIQRYLQVLGHLVQNCTAAGAAPPPAAAHDCRPHCQVLELHHSHIPGALISTAPSCMVVRIVLGGARV